MQIKRYPDGRVTLQGERTENVDSIVDAFVTELQRKPMSSVQQSEPDLTIHGNTLRFRLGAGNSWMQAPSTNLKLYNPGNEELQRWGRLSYETLEDPSRKTMHHLYGNRRFLTTFATATVSEAR